MCADGKHRILVWGSKRIEKLYLESFQVSGSVPVLVRSYSGNPGKPDGHTCCRVGGGTGELCTRNLPHWSSLNRGEGEGGREGERGRERKRLKYYLDVKHMIECCYLPLDP